MKRTAIICGALALSSSAHAHGFWSNGGPIPARPAAICEAA